METKVTPRERAMHLQGIITANEQRVAHLDATIGSLTEAMYAARSTVLEAQAELRSLQAQHYADFEREAAQA